MLDSYTHFGLADVLVPFASAWHPGAVAWGVVALYLLLTVELTSLARRYLPNKIWRRIHVASLPLYGLATIHFLVAGTASTDADSRVHVGGDRGGVADDRAGYRPAHAPTSTPRGGQPRRSTLSSAGGSKLARNGVQKKTFRRRPNRDDRPPGRGRSRATGGALVLGGCARAC